MKPNELKMLIIVIGVLAAIASHFLVHDPLTIEMEALAIEIEAAEAEKARLKAVEAQKDVLMLETEENRKIVENELSKYPEDILPETFMMYAQDLEDDLIMTLSGVNIAPPTLLSKMDIMRYIDGNNVETPIAAYMTTLGFSWNFSYNELKSFIEYVHADDYRTVINNVSVAYNAGTGHLSGSTVIYKYFITTPSYVYVPPEIPPIATGNDNPFGTLAEGQQLPQE